MAGRETPATRAERQAKVPHTLHECRHDPGADSHALEAASALEHETVLVSAGRRGLEIELAPADLIALTGAETRRLRRTSS